MPNYHEYLPHPSKGKVMQNLLADVYLKQPASTTSMKWRQLQAKHPTAAAMRQSPIQQVKLIVEWLLAKTARPQPEPARIRKE